MTSAEADESYKESEGIIYFVKNVCSYLFHVIFIFVTLFNLEIENILLENKNENGKFKDLFICFSTKQSNYITFIQSINILLINLFLNNFKQKPTQLEDYFLIHCMK